MYDIEDQAKLTMQKADNNVAKAINSDEDISRKTSDTRQIDGEKLGRNIR